MSSPPRPNWGTRLSPARKAVTVVLMQHPAAFRHEASVWFGVGAPYSLRARLRGLSTDSTQRSTWVLRIATGGGVAVPIFEPIIHAVWANVAPKTALSPPSPEAKRQLSCKSVDLESGEVQSGGKAVTECLRVDGKGRVVDTQYRLVSRSGANAQA